MLWRGFELHVILEFMIVQRKLGQDGKIKDQCGIPAG